MEEFSSQIFKENKQKRETSDFLKRRSTTLVLLYFLYQLFSIYSISKSSQPTWEYLELLY